MQTVTALLQRAQDSDGIAAVERAGQVIPQIDRVSQSL